MRLTFHAAVACVAVAAAAGWSFFACTPEQKACTAESSGHAGERALVRRDLPGSTDKPSCNPHVVAITSAADLRRAYEEAGIPIADPDGGASLANAMALPSVDFTKESVIIREATDAQGIAWMVVNGTTATVGTQGCTGAGTGVCAFQVMAVDAVVTKADGYACDDLNCGGTRVGQGSR